MAFQIEGSKYQAKALTYDTLYQLAQQRALVLMAGALQALQAFQMFQTCHPAAERAAYPASLLAQAQRYADVFSAATAEREQHRALYNKAFPTADVFRFPTPTDGSNQYCAFDAKDEI